MPAARPALTSPSASRGRRRVVGIGAGLLGAGVAAVGATALVGVGRLRPTAASHAGDLDHRATVGEGVGEPVRLLVLGDSAARGYGLDDAADAYPRQVGRRIAAATGRRVEVRATATDGHRTRDVADHQAPLVRAARPDAVVVSVGVNDAVGGTPRGELRAATQDLLAAVTAAADGAVVAFVTCPDLTDAPGLPWPLGWVTGWRCRQVAGVQAEVADDLGLGVVALPRAPADLYGVDGFHPGADGQAAMAEVTVGAMLDRAGAVRASSPAPAS